MTQDWSNKALMQILKNQSLLLVHCKEHPMIVLNDLGRTEKLIKEYIMKHGDQDD